MHFPNNVEVCFSLCKHWTVSCNFNLMLFAAKRSIKKCGTLSLIFTDKCCVGIIFLEVRLNICWICLCGFIITLQLGIQVGWHCAIMVVESLQAYHSLRFILQTAIMATIACNFTLLFLHLHTTRKCHDFIPLVTQPFSLLLTTAVHCQPFTTLNSSCFLDPIVASSFAQLLLAWKVTSR